MKTRAIVSFAITAALFLLALVLILAGAPFKAWWTVLVFMMAIPIGFATWERLS